MKRKKRILPLAIAGVLISTFFLPSTGLAAAQEDDTDSQTIAAAVAEAATGSAISLPLADGLRTESFAQDVCFDDHPEDIFPDETQHSVLTNLPDDCEVSFRSSDTSILTVEQESAAGCSYCGVRSGSAQIIAQITRSSFLFFEDKKTIRSTITVSPRAASIMFRSAKREIKKGEKAKLSVTLRPSITAEKPVFRSENTRIATITQKGVVHAKKRGTTYVTATIANGKSARCKIIVKPKKTTAKSTDLSSLSDTNESA